MDEGRRGIELVRRLEQSEQDLLQGAVQQCLRLLPPGVAEIHWVNLYLNGALTQDFPLRERLHDWAIGLAAQVYSDWPQYCILAYGFKRSPAGSADGQPFHCDYIICKPFSLLRLLPNTPHRGIANGEDHDRLLFFLTVDREPRIIPEGHFVRYSSKHYESITKPPSSP